MRKRFIYLFILTLCFQSCSRIRTDPSPAFYGVQHEVIQRTGNCISWNRGYLTCPEYQCWLSQALQAELSLDQVVQIALMNNQKLRSVYDSLGIAQAELVQAGLLENPIFSASLRYRNLTESASIIEMGIVQNFLDILLKPLKIRFARAELETTKTLVTAQVLDLIAETRIAYHHLQAEEQMLRLKTEQLQAFDASYDAAQRLRNAGNITALDLSLEQSYYEQMKIEVSSSKVRVFEEREKLNVLMGLWGCNIDWRIDPALPETEDTYYDTECIENQIIANSLDLQLSCHQMRAKAISLGIKNTEIVFPELTFGPDSERDPGEPWFVGPQFSVALPIFDIGIARKAYSRSVMSQMWNNHISMAIEIRSTARAAHFRLKTAIDQLNSFKHTINPLASQITEETLHQFNAMQLGVFELLLAKQRELEIRLKSVTAYKNYWIARTEVEMLLNGRMVPSLKNSEGQR